jgi:uncharacterized protein (TIGR00369 family)
MNLLEIYNKSNAFGQLLDMKYDIISPGNINYFLTVKPTLLATAKAMHGGALAAFMDAIVGVAALSAVYQENKLVATIEFKINFMQPAMLNDELTGKGLVVKKGKSIMVSEGKIFNQKNELIAMAIATLRAYPFEKSDYC